MLFYAILAMLTLALSAGLFLNRTIKQHVKAVSFLSPVVVTASNTLTNQGIDTQGFDSAMMLVNVGAVVGAGIANVALYESPTNNSDYTAVAAAQTDSDIATNATLVAGKVYRLGYLGGMRYIAVLITWVSGTSVLIGITAVLGDPTEAPVAAS